MGIKYVGADVNFARTLEVQIRQLGKRAAKHAVEEMRDGADEIVKLAKDFSPEDEGKLEAAIKRNPSEERDSERGGRRIVAVWVDPNMPGSGGMPVGDYAYMMHEGLFPYGDGTYGLNGPRPGTAAKQARGLDAGGKFFERAIDLIKGRMTDRIMGLMRRQKII